MGLRVNAVLRPSTLGEQTSREAAPRGRGIPGWLVAVGVVAVATAYLIASRPSYREAFEFVRSGLGITILTSFAAYLCALVLGMLAAFGRISSNRLANNLATLYVEMVRGVPMLVLIFFIALVALPAALDGLNALGAKAAAWRLEGLAGWLAGMRVREIPMNVRAVIALSITYGAFQAEIFRAGIQSVPRGQMEAARAQGMSYIQAMRYIILPQALRNVLPALGNDFISMLKDSSLVSVLAVRDITQMARLYAGQSFRFSEAYTVLAVLYLSMTIFLSGLVKVLERRVNRV